VSRRRLQELAAAICDGEEIDWPALARNARPDLGRAIGGLATLQALFGTVTSRESQAPRWRDRLAPAAGLVMLLAAVQCSAAVMGYLVQSDEGYPGPEALPLAVIVTLACSALALVTQGRRDRRAISLAGFFLCLASAPAQRLVAPLRAILPNAQFVLGPGIFPDCFVPFFLWRFARDFPRTLRFSRLDRVAEWAQLVSVGAGLVLFFANAIIELAYDGGGPGGLTVLSRSRRGWYWTIEFLLVVPALLVLPNRSSLAPEGERRRVRLFLLGLVGGVLPMVVQVLLESLFPAYDQFANITSRAPAVDAVLYGLLLATPIVTTYSVIVHHVLDVRTILRVALRYVLARYTVALATAVPFIVLVMQLYGERHRSLADLFQGTRGAWLAAAAAAGLAALTLRQRMLRALDRRFFGTSRPLQDMLPELTAEISAARDARAVASVIEPRVRAALQVEAVAMLVCDEEGALRAPRGTVRSLPGDSALRRWLSEARGVIDLSPERDGSCFALLPAAEREWLADGPFSTLVPLVGRDETLLGVLAVGPRRTDEPLEPGHRTAVRTAAASCAVALEHLARGGPAILPGALPDAADVPAAECERCGVVYPPSASGCPCGGPLASAALPCVLAGKFAVSQRVGRGGMGIVYKALDTELHRAVAIKTLPRVSAAAVLDMRREARTMASVAHPNLAILYGLESWCGAPMLIAEFLDGGTLADRIGLGPLAIPDVVHLGITMADCIAYLHGQGLLHRDIKPSNIGFTRAGTPKLLDFGLSGLVTGGEYRPAATEPDSLATKGAVTLATGVIAGTPAYLAPESLHRASPGPSADIWALALVLHEALTGVNPFAGGRVEDVLTRVRAARVPDVRSLRPECPAWLATLLGDALARAPDVRPNARRLQERLEQPNAARV
jgi:hypothetical protein